MAASALRATGFAGKIVGPDSPEYATLSVRASAIAVAKPRFIVQPLSSEEVSAAIKFATQSRLPIAVKCGGHHYSKVSSVDDGVVIDMGAFKNVTIDKANERVAFGGGCLWGDVYPALQAEGLMCAGGGVHVVGVGGHITGGGYGPLTRKIGLACDNVLEMTVVLADGSIVTANEHEHPDLFWGIKGSSSTFGIVTQFAVRTYPAAGQLFLRTLIFSPKVFTEVVDKVNHHATNIGPNNSTPLFYFMRGPAPDHHPVLMAGFMAPGNPEDYASDVEPFLNLSEKPLADTTKISEDLVDFSHSLDEILLYGGPRKLNAGIVITGISQEMAKDSWERFLDITSRSKDFIDTKYAFEFHNCARLRPELSSFAIETPKHGTLVIMEEHHEEGHDREALTWLNEAAAAASSYIDKTEYKAVYGSNSSSVGMKLKIEDIYGKNIARLREVKTKYDPNNVFNLWHSLWPEASRTKL